jgi:hypothetical protein
MILDKLPGLMEDAVPFRIGPLPVEAEGTNNWVNDEWELTAIILGASATCVGLLANTAATFSLTGGADLFALELIANEGATGALRGDLFVPIGLSETLQISNEGPVFEIQVCAWGIAVPVNAFLYGG